MNWLLFSTGIVLFVINSIKGQDTFYFITNPKTKDVVEGDSVMLMCDVSSRKHVTFQWTLNNHDMSNTSRRYQIGSNLQINHVSRNYDVEAFRCIATNVSTGFSLKSTEGRINVMWLGDTARVELLSPSTETAITVSSTVSLRCAVSGNPTPEMEWYRNKIRLFNNQQRIGITQNGQRLDLQTVSAADNGIFSCRGKNQADHRDSNNNFLLAVKAPNMPHLDKTKFTQMKMVKRGTRAQFDCVYSNVMLTEWYLGDKKLNNRTNTNHDILIYSNGTLVFLSVRSRDGHTYKCTGIHMNGNSQTYTADLHIAILDDFSSESFEPRVTSSAFVKASGERFSSECFMPHGQPQPIISWYDNRGRNIISTSGRVYITRNQLVITSVQDQDTGNFSCVATNLAGTKRGYVALIVSVAPKIIRGPDRQLQREEGSSAEFSCQVSGTAYPVTKIKWLKNGNLLDKSIRRFNINEAKGTLRITNIVLSDAGKYECLVNTTGHPPVKAVTPAVLKVLKKLKFVSRPTDTFVELGDKKARVYCRAEAEGKTPIIKWLKNNNIYFPPHVTFTDRGTLKFSGVDESDAGMYTCIAEADLEKINATIRIDVVVKPKWSTIPANRTAFEGYPILIDCIAVGRPKPVMTWDKAGKHDYFDGNNRFHIFKNGTLLIRTTSKSDWGVYGCTAGNSGGFVRKEMYLRVKDTDQYVPSSSNIADDEEDTMTKTVLIAVLSAFAYLALVGGLTIYCGIRVMRRRKAQRAARDQNGDLTATNDSPNPQRVRTENGIYRPEQQQKLMEVEAAMSHSSRSNYTQSHKSNFTKSDNSRSNRTTSNHSNHTPSHRSNSERARSPELRSDMERQSQVSGMSSPHSHSSHSQPRSKRTSYDNLKFPRHDLHTIGMLGKGVYGEVFLAKAFGIRDNEKETMVVVKSLVTQDETIMYDYCQEVDMYSKLNHENIVKLLGVCKDIEPQYMLTEYCEWGDLKQFLLALMKDGGKNVKVPPLTIAQKISICNQIALGMEHLSNRRFIHKDLAARNILLSPNMTIKVSSLSLCKDFYAAEYYKYKDKILPVRWLSPEVVLDDEYSTKSDVWSFGVLLWEVLTSGELPYFDKSNEEVLAGLKSWSLYPDVLPCSDDLQALMAQCWAECPKDRPSFSDVALTLGEMTVDSTV